jgi:hypothetical protein
VGAKDETNLGWAVPLASPSLTTRTLDMDGVTWDGFRGEEISGER